MSYNEFVQGYNDVLNYFNFFRSKRQHIALPLKQEDAQTFDTICLNDPENVNQNQDGVDGGTMPVLPHMTWTEMHDEFYAEPPKNPGKILLLYSPDTKQFKELQVKLDKALIPYSTLK